MEDQAQKHITRLLVEWKTGNREALDLLMPMVYQELRKLADHYLRNERADHTLQPTALIHEAYLR
ncbi:MAG: RNA polymerase subunit sigma-70, partial [Bryobacterales bacterium]|nr:RNA polymerase subunit sigma-70 [Bryobacterales bacterium]